MREVVLVGAGHAHLQVLRRLGRNALPGIRLTLISPDTHMAYSGMLPGLIAGHYRFEEAHIDIGALCRFAGVRFCQSAVVALDRAAKNVLCDNRPLVPYDLLSINAGSAANTQAIPGAVEYSIPVKPVHGFPARFDGLLQRAIAARGRRHVALVGAGAGGVELMLAIEHRLRREVERAGGDASALAFTLVSATPEILPDFPRSFRERFSRILSEKGISLITGAAAIHLERGLLHLEGHAPLAVDDVLWATGAQPPSWLKDACLPLDEGGFVRVDAFLRVLDCPDIFAAGDIIAFPPRGLPKSGVYAVRAGAILGENIRRSVLGSALKPFHPQRNALYLLSTGEKRAIGTRNSFVFGGSWVWRWKDWIDRKFIRDFQFPPEGHRREREGC